MADRNQLKVADRQGIADDDPFAELTRIMGFDPRQPVARKEAPDPVMGDDFDIAILDVNLPGGGPQLARAVKEIHPAGHIVVFSGQDGEETRHLMLDAGADQYVVKNGRLKPLMQALDRIR